MAILDDTGLKKVLTDLRSEFKTDTLVAGDTTTDTLETTGATSLGSTLGVSGATTLGSTLGVSGATTLTGALNANSTLTVAGATSLKSTLSITGTTTSSSTITASDFLLSSYYLLRCPSSSGYSLSTSSTGSNYLKLEVGYSSYYLLIQWGRSASPGSSSSFTTRTITFPTSFSTIVSCLCNDIVANSSAGNDSHVYSISTSTLVLSAPPSRDVSWLAIGLVSK